MMGPETSLTMMLLIVASVAGLEDGVTVSLMQGQISGFKEVSTKGNEFFSFHGIPYAKPPIGTLRLKDPVPHEGWTGVRNGSVVPPVCPQIPFILAAIRKPVFDGDEDCLYLSVFTSEPGNVDAQKPVMVFIHGGAFFGGGLSKYSPNVLLNEDVVFVLIQYRLGMLGFLSTEDDVIPGNFGMKDQVLALQWVQNNIHNFGGDRHRVTIFGESAGGASVHFHILSPRSEGLFARGILQSGTLHSPWAMGGAFKDVAKYTGHLFKCPESEIWSAKQNSIALLSCLQNVDVVNLTMSLMHHIHWNFNPVMLGPRVDGDYLPRDPELLMRDAQHTKVDIISGINAHEGALFALPLFAVESLKTDLLNNFEEFGPGSLDISHGDSSPVEMAKAIFDFYVGGVKASPEDADNLCKMYGDWQFNMGHDIIGKLYPRNAPHKKTFLYELNHKGQRSLGDVFGLDIGKHWVSHVDDLYYLFTGENTLWKTLEHKEDLQLRDIITRLWYNFAATGNPTPDETLGFIWEAVSETQTDHLSLTPSPAMEKDRRQEVRKFLQSLPTKLNSILHPEHISPIDTSTSSGKNGQQERNNQVLFKPRKYSSKDEL